MNQEFIGKVERYFSDRLSWGAVKVSEAKRLTGGISRETWRVMLRIEGKGDTANERAVILRIDPAVSVLESNRDLEYTIFQAFEKVSGVPVPHTICNEDDPQYLGSSFMAMDVLPGVAEIPVILAPPFAQVGPQIAREHFRILGIVATTDIDTLGPARLGLEEVSGSARSPATAWSDALSHWEKLLQNKSLGPAPITCAAIRYLKRNTPPPPRQLSVVHGDYRLGNCLYLPDGTVSGVLDWEMTHQGDPLEDLAWALMPNWCPSAAPGKIAGHLTVDDAIAAWEASSGIQVDRKALAWWQLFSSVKSAAIFTTGGYNFLQSKTADDVIYALIGWISLHYEESRMIDLMGVRA